MWVASVLFTTFLIKCSVINLLYHKLNDLSKLSKQESTLHADHLTSMIFKYNMMEILYFENRREDQIKKTSP